MPRLTASAARRAVDALGNVAAAARALGVEPAEIRRLLPDLRPPGRAKLPPVTREAAQAARDLIPADGGAAVRALGQAAVARALGLAGSTIRAQLHHAKGGPKPAPDKGLQEKRQRLQKKG